MKIARHSPNIGRKKYLENAMENVQFSKVRFVEFCSRLNNSNKNEGNFE